MNVMSIKLGDQGAIAYGNARMCFSGIYGSKRSPATAESFACRLADDWNLLKPEHIFAAHNGQNWPKSLQPLVGVLQSFCRERGLKLHAIHTASFRCHLVGWPATSDRFLKQLKNAGPRNINEADVMALLDYGTCWLADMAAAGGLKR